MGLSTTPNTVWTEEQPPLRHYEIVGDAIPASLTGSKGDPAAGRAIVLSRQNTCLLCHSGPFPEERFQGNTVSMTISVDSPMTELDHVKSIHIFTEKNPQPKCDDIPSHPARWTRARFGANTACRLSKGCRNRPA